MRNRPYPVLKCSSTGRILQGEKGQAKSTYVHAHAFRPACACAQPTSVLRSGPIARATAPPAATKAWCRRIRLRPPSPPLQFKPRPRGGRQRGGSADLGPHGCASGRPVSIGPQHAPLLALCLATPPAGCSLLLSGRGLGGQGSLPTRGCMLPGHPLICPLYRIDRPGHRLQRTADAPAHRKQSRARASAERAVRVGPRAARLGARPLGGEPSPS